MRQKNNMTQLNVAEKLNITPQAVSKWERCESMPDITLLPELADMYGITVEDILRAGADARKNDYGDIMQALNTFVDEKIFEKVRSTFENAKHVRELNIPMDFFMALNTRQKDILLELLLDIEDYEIVTEDIIQYLTMPQRARLIKRVAENGNYELLEILFPFSTQAIRTEAVMLLLEQERFDFPEEILLFLNHEQKELIIHHFIDNGLNFEKLVNCLPFFDKEQRRLITEKENLL